MDRNIRLLILFNFLIEFSFYTPIAILYFSRVTGSYTLGMSIFSVVMLSAAICELPTGIFSDMIGRKKTMVLGSLSATSAVIFYAIGGTYTMLIIGAILEGLGRSFYSGNNDALLHDIVSNKNQLKKYNDYLGKLSAIEQFGMAIVAVLGSIVAYWSFTIVMWLSVIPKIINIGLSLSIIEPKTHIKQSGNIFFHLSTSLKHLKKNYRLQLLTINSMLGYAIGEASYLFRSAFVKTLWPIWAIGLTNVLSSFGASISFYFSGKILQKYGYKKTLTFQTVFNRIINFTALLFPSAFSPALMTTTSLTYGVGSVTERDLLQKEYTSDQRATLGSLTSFFGSLLFAFVALVLGFIADKTTPATALIISNIFMLIPLLLYQKIFVNKKSI